MKKLRCTVLYASLFIFIGTISHVSAGHVVTDDIKTWAKKAIQQETAIDYKQAPSNSWAVLYFKNKTEQPDFDLLEKGLPLMLMTDLSKVKDIQIVERVKIQAIVSELGLNTSGLTQQKNSSRVGKLLGAANIIGGNILDEKIKQFRLKSSLLNVEEKRIIGQPAVKGELLAELFKMEKELLFHIIDQLNIQLTAKQRKDLEKPLTANIRALMLLFQAIEYSDQGNYKMAQNYYEMALAEDPDLNIAEQGISEIKMLGLNTAGPGAVEAYSEESRRIEVNRRDNVDKNIDVAGIENAILNKGGISVSWEFLFEEETTEATAYKTAASVENVANPDTPSDTVSVKNENDSKKNDFLTYAVRLDEDQMNKKIMKIHRQEIEELRALESIDKAISHSDLRRRDAWLTQKADAQAGRVLKDIHGNWVRVQQYILRPDDTTVQVLNVCLRTGTNEGLSVMNWKTNFNTGYRGDLRSLPWSDWLNIQSDAGAKHISYDASAAVNLTDMSVQFTNPGDESLSEAISFNPYAAGRQNVQTEKLVLFSNTGTSGEYINNYDTGVMQYQVTPQGKSPGGFSYSTAIGDTILDVGLSIVGDIDTVDDNFTNESKDSITDIWDAMRVNEQNAVSIGNNNLEITIDQQGSRFSKPIDVVYVPMSRMIWKSQLD